MISQLPKEVQDQLICTDYKIIDLLNGRMFWHAKHSPKGGEYWNSGIKWIAGIIGRSYTWTAKRIKFLHKLGVITRVRRRREKGRWVTNLYKLGPLFVKILRGTKAAAAAWIYHVKCTLHIGRKPLSTLKDKGFKDSLRSAIITNKEDDLDYYAALPGKYAPEEAI